MEKVWFITGASRGLGVEIGRVALEAGDRVVATGRDRSTVEKAFGRSPHVLPLRLDVTRQGATEEAVQAAVEHFGRIDVLVNNAGYALYGAVEECSEEEVRGQFETNVLGLLAVTRAVLPVLRAQRRGHIFNLSSVAGFRGNAGASSYDASKFAVEGLSEALAAEVAPLGIKVTIVEPGLFRTDFLTSTSMRWAAKIVEDYAPTTGRLRRLLEEWNGAQANDPRKLARALVTLANSEQPPLRFTAGADAVRWHEEVLKARREELERWRSLSTSLGFAPSMAPEDATFCSPQMSGE